MLEEHVIAASLNIAFKIMASQNILLYEQMFDRLATPSCVRDKYDVWTKMFDRLVGRVRANHNRGSGAKSQQQ